MGPIATSFLASLGAGLATGIGAIPALFFGKASDRLLDVMLGFADGVMIAASMFRLLVPAFRLGGIPVTILGSIIGMLLLDRANLLNPMCTDYEGRKGRRQGFVGHGSCCWLRSFTTYWRGWRSV